MSKKAPRLAVRIDSQAYVDDAPRHYRWMLAQAPVCRARVSVLRVRLVARHADCTALLKDPRLVRNRTTATGGGRFPVPLPRRVKPLVASMINEDPPNHRRQRTLVAKAFTPRALASLEERIERLTHDLLDAMDTGGPVDLIDAYALPIPTTVIREMLGVDAEDMPKFSQGLRALTEGFSGLAMVRTLLFDMPRVIDLVEDLIARKRQAPRDDILTALIQAEEAGDSLSHGELVAMAILLIIAGYETTVHLIANAVAALLAHPDQLAALKADPSLVDSAVEEVLRYDPPVQGTKPHYPTEPVEVAGYVLPKGKPVLFALGAASRDPAVFTDPDRFDIRRSPNPHLGFGAGPHFCLGAALARMETRIALRNLFARFPDLRLAVPPGDLKRQRMPFWSRYEQLPLVLR